MKIHILHQGVTLCGFRWYLAEPGDRWVPLDHGAQLQHTRSACDRCLEAYDESLLDVLRPEHKFTSKA